MYPLKLRFIRLRIFFPSMNPDILPTTNTNDNVREEEISETPKKGNCKIFTIENGMCQIFDGVERIENGCFFNYKNLTKVIFPSSLKEIGDYAFYGTAITKIVIPKNVTKIGSYAFANSDITYCNVLNDNAIIGNGCLTNCKN